MNTTLYINERTPSVTLAVVKLRLMEPGMPASEREYLEKMKEDLKIMVEEHNDQWMDFGDGDLS